MAEEISFFSELDYSDKGNISSEYPAWYFDKFIDDLKEQVRVDEESLDMGLIPSEHRPMVAKRISDSKRRLHEIEDGRPKLTQADETKLKAFREQIGKDIAGLQFTRSDMMKGLASPEMEAKRRVMPCIKIDPSCVKFALAARIPINRDGMVSRDGAEKMWKIASKYFGENSNTEVLRRD